MLSGCATYRAGVALPDTDTPVTALAARSPGRLTWISLHDPSEAECDRLSGTLHLPPWLSDALRRTRPRTGIERIKPSGFVLSVGVARYDQDRDLVDIGSLTIAVLPEMMITITRGTPSPMDEVRRELESREGALSRGPGFVTWVLLHHVVEGYRQVLRDLRSDVEVMERTVFADHVPGGATQRIYLLKREAIDFDQAVGALLDPLEELGTGRHAVAADDGVPEWSVLRDRVLRVADRAEALSDLLTGVLTAYQTDVALKQNEDMRKISAWVAIAAVPTLVAGVYGMNFENMPELRSEYGYFVVVGVMVAICASLYAVFRSKHWL
ncbi:magnesium and cobalt transport protein CorA [Euzebya sp.]|uniref:magnesium and cobalt transport protein CorA n=1 Tax=Euzebya sp. TaxID=1971409 RepID=UPI003518CED9